MMTMHYSTWGKYLNLPLDLDPLTIGNLTQSNEHSTQSAQINEAYKRFDKCVKPISQCIPQEFKVTKSIPYNPLTTLIPLDTHFSENQATVKFTYVTVFLTPLELLHIISFPIGFTNSPSEFQEYMVFIFQDEIVSQIMNVFIYDAPICGLSTIYPNQDGNPTVLTERPGIQRYIWEHAVDLDCILH